MALYRDHIYPHLVSILGDPRPIHDIRRRVLPLAQGNVLEIGVGPGINFALYDPAKVTKLYALEPNPGMIRMAEQQRRRTKLNIEFLDLPGETNKAIAPNNNMQTGYQRSQGLKQCNIHKIPLPSEAKMIPHKLILWIAALLLCALPQDMHPASTVLWQTETGG